MAWGERGVGGVGNGLNGSAGQGKGRQRLRRARKRSETVQGTEKCVTSATEGWELVSKGAGVNLGPATAWRGRDEALSAAVPPLGAPAPPTRQSSQAARDRGSGPGVWTAVERQRLPPSTYARGREAPGSRAATASRLLKFLQSWRAAVTSSERAGARDIWSQWRRRRWDPGRLRLHGEGALRLDVRGPGRRRPGPRRQSRRWTAESCFVASGRPSECGVGPGSDSQRLGNLFEPLSLSAVCKVGITANPLKDYCEDLTELTSSLQTGLYY